MERQVANKQGIYPFIEHLNGFSTEHYLDLDEEDIELLAKILDCEGGR